MKKLILSLFLISSFAFAQKKSVDCVDYTKVSSNKTNNILFKDTRVCFHHTDGIITLNSAVYKIDQMEYDEEEADLYFVCNKNGEEDFIFLLGSNGTFSMSEKTEKSGVLTLFN